MLLLEKQIFKMKILGRSPKEKSSEASERAQAKAGPKMEIDYVSGAQGTAVVQVFTSEDDEDRGGVMLRFTVKQPDCSFIPALKDIDDGVELHIAGDAEAASFIKALRGILAALPDPIRYQDNKY